MILTLVIELEIRKTMPLRQLHNINKELILKNVLQSEALIQYWSITSVNWGDESETLLKLIVEH